MVTCEIGKGRNANNRYGLLLLGAGRGSLSYVTEFYSVFANSDTLQMTSGDDIQRKVDELLCRQSKSKEIHAILQVSLCGKFLFKTS